MNDLDLCLWVVLRSCQPLHYIRRWISRKPLEIEAWFQRTTNRKWHTGYQMVTWPMTSRDLEKSNSWPPIRLERNISKTAGFSDSVQKAHQWEMAYGLSNSHVTDEFTWPPKVLWGSTVGYPSDSLASCFVCCSLSIILHLWLTVTGPVNSLLVIVFSYCPFPKWVLKYTYIDFICVSVLV